jgi:hypothetical protein
MTERYLILRGRMVDLDTVKCEAVFEDNQDVLYCERKKEQYLAATEEVEKYY